MRGVVDLANAGFEEQQVQEEADMIGKLQAERDALKALNGELKNLLLDAVTAADRWAEAQGDGPSILFMGFDTEKARAVLAKAFK